MGAGNLISASAYADYLISQEPYYDEEIVRDIRPPEAGLIGYYSAKPFEAFTGNQHTYDRLRVVYPNTTLPWYPRAVPSPITNEAGYNCVSNQCDSPPNYMTWGTTRNTYQLFQQEWRSDVMCLDEMMPKTRAREQWTQIISDVLSPASQYIVGDWLNKWAFMNGNLSIYGGTGPQIATNSGLVPFTFSWDGGNPAQTDPWGQYGFAYLNTSGDPTSKITPLMLQAQVNPQYRLGALKKAPQSMLGKLQFHTDNDTFYSMVQGNPNINDRVRFNDAAAFETGSREFYKYGVMGTVGDYNIKVLPFLLRFNQVSSGRYNVVQPYVNSATTLGLGSTANGAYDQAQYQMSYINNPMALEFAPFRPGAVNKQMPFMLRDYAGKWSFGISDLGADAAGKPIENYKKNKGIWFADFRMAMKPTHPEWLIPIFHLREPPCQYGVANCNPSPGYPQQSYNSAPTECPYVTQWALVLDSSTNTYVIPANSTLENGNYLTHVQIASATSAGLATALNANATLGALGTWAIDPTGVYLQLTEASGQSNLISVFFQQN